MPKHIAPQTKVREEMARHYPSFLPPLFQPSLFFTISVYDFFLFSFPPLRSILMKEDSRKVVLFFFFLPVPPVDFLLPSSLSHPKGRILVKLGRPSSSFSFPHPPASEQFQSVSEFSPLLPRRDAHGYFASQILNSASFSPFFPKSSHVFPVSPPLPPARWSRNFPPPFLFRQTSLGFLPLYSEENTKRRPTLFLPSPIAGREPLLFFSLPFASVRNLKRKKR